MTKPQTFAIGDPVLEPDRQRVGTISELVPNRGLVVVTYRATKTTPRLHVALDPKALRPASVKAPSVKFAKLRLDLGLLYDLFGPSPITAPIRFTSMPRSSSAVFQTRWLNWRVSKCTLSNMSSRHENITGIFKPCAKPAS